MSCLRVFASRALATLRPRTTDADLQKQIDAHLDEAAEEYVRRGLSPDEARRRARVDFGSITSVEDVHRRQRAFTWVDDALRDLRYGMRAMSRTPVVSLFVVVTLALASGVSVSLFTTMDAAVLRPLPYHRPQDIVAVDVGEAFGSRMAPSADDIDALTATSMLAGIGMGRLSGFAPIIVDAGTPERLVVGTATEGLFEVFGVKPLLGRAFSAADRQPGAPAVVMVGHRYWQSRLQGAPDVLGRIIRVDDTPSTIVGVMPAGFHPRTMVWQPHVTPSSMRSMRGSGVPVYARLRPDAQPEVVASALVTRLVPDPRTGPTNLWLVPLYDLTIERHRRAVVLMSSAVALMVAIACVNVAVLLLGRGAARRAELAVRWSLGATRGRLIRQVLTEVALLAVVGGLMGAAFAFLTLDAVRTVVPLHFDDHTAPAITARALLFALAFPVVTAIATGLTPALTLAHTVARGAMATRSRIFTTLTTRGGQVLVAAQVAMSLVLLVGAFLMLKSFSRIQSIDVGFDPDALLTMFVVPADRPPESEKVTDADEATYRALIDTVRGVPGVQAAGGADRPPLDGSASYSIVAVEGRSVMVAERYVTRGYFEAVRLPVRAGRLVTESEDRGSARFTILSESAARRLFGARNAVGHTVEVGGMPALVLGVVGDARNKDPLVPDVQPDIYLVSAPPPTSAFGRGMTLVVRPEAPGVALAARLRAAAQSVGSRIIVEDVRSGRDLFNEQVAHRRHITFLLSALGSLGLLLTVVGIFGATLFAVTSRTREGGIRMALGARAQDVVRALVVNAMTPVVAGLLIGTAAAAVFVRVIESFLFQTTARDPAVFAIVIGIALFTGLLAAWAPASRAARIDPVRAVGVDQQ